MSTMRKSTRHADFAATLAFATKRLSERGVQLTPIRLAVLQLLCRERRDIGAYDLLFAYEKTVGRRSTANTIYRALHFLEEHGLVAHLSSTRTYIVRAFRESTEPSVFFVCGGCKTTAECEDPHIERAVSARAKTIGFSARSRSIEVQGICEECVSHRKRGQLAGAPMPRGHSTDSVRMPKSGPS
jgi:Fur family zinc uptake transcriptional regulator